MLVRTCRTRAKTHFRVYQNGSLELEDLRLKCLRDLGYISAFSHPGPMSQTNDQPRSTSQRLQWRISKRVIPHLLARTHRHPTKPPPAYYNPLISSADSSRPPIDYKSDPRLLYKACQLGIQGFLTRKVSPHLMETYETNMSEIRDTHHLAS